MEHIAKIEQIVRDAAEKNASDIHCTPGSPMMYRIDGKIVVASEEITGPSDVDEMIFPLLTEKQKAELEENGEVGFAYSLTGVSRIRINVYRQRGTYALSIRILPSDIFSEEQLGIPEAILNLTRKKKGLILVTGPAGSGKSTTIASLMNMIAEEDARKIISIEDPIEYLFQHKKSMVNQREVGYDTKSYAAGLASALRQDPDVIMVGELRDLETIELALSAAETGHLVIAALYTENTVAAVERLVDIFPQEKQQQIRVQLSNVLCGVMAQQLLPRADGTGRVAAYEVLLVREEIKEMIQKGKTHQIRSAMVNGRKDGMQLMDDAIYDLYMRSAISTQMAVRFAEDGAGMQQKIFLFQ